MTRPYDVPVPGPSPAALSLRDQEIVADYTAGMSASSVAKQHGTNQKQVLDAVRRAGHRPRSANPPVGRDWDLEVAAGYRAGQTSCELAVEHQVTVVGVFGALRRAREPVRPDDPGVSIARRPAPPDPSKPGDLARLRLPERAENALRRNGVHTVADAHRTYLAGKLPVMGPGGKAALADALHHDQTGHDQTGCTEHETPTPGAVPLPNPVR